MHTFVVPSIENEKGAQREKEDCCGIKLQSNEYDKSL